MLKLLYTSQQTVPNLTSSSTAYWHPPSDSLFVSGIAGNGSQRVYRDGSTHHVSRVSTNGDVLRFDHAPTAPSHIAVHSQARGGWFQLHALLWTPDFQRPIASALTQTQLGGGAAFRNRAGVMKYYRPSGRGYTVRDVATGVLEDTVEIFPSGSNIHSRLHWVRDQLILVLRDDNIRIWDTAAHTTVLDSFVETPRLMAFDPVNQNILTIRQSDNRVQVWALEVQPFQFGNLQANPGEYLRFQKEDLSIQVLGEQGEPCAGIDVYWLLTQSAFQLQGDAINSSPINTESLGGSFTAVPTQGEMHPIVSRSDEQGLAETVYCPPGPEWVPDYNELIIHRMYVTHQPAEGV